MANWQKVGSHGNEKCRFYTRYMKFFVFKLLCRESMIFDQLQLLEASEFNAFLTKDIHVT